MIETSVLFITFVRPDYARRKWDGIKSAQPKKLYFYSNNGRTEKEGEIGHYVELYKVEVDLLQTIPGVGRDSAISLISEIGVDMSNFETDQLEDDNSLS